MSGCRRRRRSCVFRRSNGWQSLKSYTTEYWPFKYPEAWKIHDRAMRQGVSVTVGFCFCGNVDSPWKNPHSEYRRASPLVFRCRRVCVCGLHCSGLNEFGPRGGRKFPNMADPNTENSPIARAQHRNFVIGRKCNRMAPYAYFCFFFLFLLYFSKAAGGGREASYAVVKPNSPKAASFARRLFLCRLPG